MVCGKSKEYGSLQFYDSLAGSSDSHKQELITETLLLAIKNESFHLEATRVLSVPTDIVITEIRKSRFRRAAMVLCRLFPRLCCACNPFTS